MPKADPVATKQMRAESCYFGALTLGQSRDTYLKSLGKDEPSEKKLPSFGIDAPAGKTASPFGMPPSAQAPSSSASAHASTAGLPSPSSHTPPTGPSGMPPFGPGRGDMMWRMPFERQARACTNGAGIPEIVSPEVDRALREIAPVAAELAQTLGSAKAYYDRADFKGDSFAKGKELHKTLTDKFGQLEDLRGKLGDALNAWRAGHPVDTSKLDPRQLAMNTATEDARSVLLALTKMPLKLADVKASVAKLEAPPAEAQPATGPGTAQPTGAKLPVPNVAAFVKGVNDALAKPKAESGLELNDWMTIVNSYTSLLEANQRSLTRVQGPGLGASGGFAPKFPGVRPQPAAAGTH